MRTKPVYVREDFRRDGLFINFLAGPEVMLSLARAFPGSTINAGYPGICDQEYLACAAICSALKAEDNEVAFVGHARKDHLKTIATIVNKAQNTSANFWIPLSDTFMNNTMKMSERDLINLSTGLIKYWKDELSNRPLDVAVADCTAPEKGILERFQKVYSELEKAGVRSIILCDTRGIGKPEQIANLFKIVAGGTSLLEFHPHRDFCNVRENIDAAVSSGATIIGSAVHGLGERGTMVDPRQISSWYGTPYNCRQFDLFEQSYRKLPCIREAQVLSEKVIVTGTQHRLFGRGNLKDMLFGVTSDRYMLANLIGSDQESISYEELRALKDKLYLSEKLVFSGKEAVDELRSIRGINDG